jgi:hypothetical protein
VFLPHLIVTRTIAPSLVAQHRQPVVGNSRTPREVGSAQHAGAAAATATCLCKKHSTASAAAQRERLACRRGGSSNTEFDGANRRRRRQAARGVHGAGARSQHSTALPRVFAQQQSWRQAQEESRRVPITAANKQPERKTRAAAAEESSQMPPSTLPSDRCMPSRPPSTTTCLKSSPSTGAKMVGGQRGLASRSVPCARLQVVLCDRRTSGIGSSATS